MYTRSVRDLFIEAIAMRRKGRPAREIREKLIELGHKAGWMMIDVIGRGSSYMLIFGNSGSIAYDGTKYRYDSAS
jgi:hypothetical protein